MRIGIRLPDGAERSWAVRADELGLASVVIDRSSPGATVVTTGAVSAVTRDVRLVVTIEVGHVHPVALAEQLAVLDNLSGGRVVGLLRPADRISETAMTEDIILLARCLRPGPVRHHGDRWMVPAELEEHESVRAVEVTPKPVQPQLPLWLAPTVSGNTAARLRVPRVADDPELLRAYDDVDHVPPVSPAIATLRGDVDIDRDTVATWAHAGATDLLLSPASEMTVDDVMPVARFLAPEVAMPHFPRIVAESPLPAAWPSA